jgi:colicin import membrane protein
VGHEISDGVSAARLFTEPMMSSVVVQPRSAATPAPDTLSDPFELGWRELVHYLPDGSHKVERQPLTRWDILHPQEGDFRLHTDEHERFCIYLYNLLTRQVADDPHAVVLHDTRVAWDDPAIEPHGPDIALIFNVRERRNWSTFDCAQEGTKPTLIIEVTSPKTRSVDLEDKVDEYEQVGVEYYVIVDIRRRGRGEVRQLLGRHLTPEGYVPMVANEQGWLWLDPVQLWLGLRGTELACYDQNGDYLEGLPARLVQQVKAAEEQFHQEAKARIAAEERLRQLEAELRRLRGQPDQ